MENGYKNLIVWQKSKELAIEIYRLTENFPKSETYGIISQMRRSAISIPSNIAEGYRRGHQKERKQFISIAFGSGAELETQIEISKEIFKNSKLEFEKSDSLLQEIMRMLNKLSSIN